MGGKGKGRRGERHGGSFGLRDTGIFRDRVPLDEDAIFDEVTQSDLDRSPLPRPDGPAHGTAKDVFLQVARQLAERNLTGRRDLPKDEFDKAWLNLPPDTADAFSLRIAVDWLEKRLDDQAFVSMCRREGRRLLQRHAEWKKIRQLPPADLDRLLFDMGGRNFWQIMEESFRIGRLIERLQVRPHEHDAVAGREARKARRLGALKAHEKRFGPPPVKAALDRQYQEIFDAVQRQHPRWTPTQVSRRAVEIGVDRGLKMVHPETVRRHWKKRQQSLSLSTKQC